MLSILNICLSASLESTLGTRLLPPEESNIYMESKNIVKLNALPNAGHIYNWLYLVNY